jgi:hypothetical protein
LHGRTDPFDNGCGGEDYDYCKLRDDANNGERPEFRSSPEDCLSYGGDDSEKYCNRWGDTWPRNGWAPACVGTGGRLGEAIRMCCRRREVRAW